MDYIKTKEQDITRQNLWGKYGELFETLEDFLTNKNQMSTSEIFDFVNYLENISLIYQGKRISFKDYLLREDFGTLDNINNQVWPELSPNSINTNEVYTIKDQSNSIFNSFNLLNELTAIHAYTIELLPTRQVKLHLIMFGIDEDHINNTFIADWQADAIEKQATPSNAAFQDFKRGTKINGIGFRDSPHDIIIKKCIDALVQDVPHDKSPLYNKFISAYGGQKMDRFMTMEMLAHCKAKINNQIEPVSALNTGGSINWYTKNVNGEIKVFCDIEQTVYNIQAGFNQYTMNSQTGNLEKTDIDQIKDEKATKHPIIQSKATIQLDTQEINGKMVVVPQIINYDHALYANELTLQNDNGEDLSNNYPLTSGVVLVDKPNSLDDIETNNNYSI